MRNDLNDVLNAILISQKTFSRIKLNFLWAFIYNIMLIPLAMGVFYPIFEIRMSPMLAAIAMALSSISVIVSSVMLNKYNP